MAKKLTANQIAYNKEVKRIKAAINRNAKQGYFLPEELTFERPDRITKKNIEALKQITPKRLRKASTHYDINTGELITRHNEEMLSEIKQNIPKKKPPKEPPKKEPPKITVIDRVRAALYDLANESGVPISSRKAEVINIFDETLEDMGPEAYGDYLETVEEEIFYHVERVTYHSSPREVEQSFANLGRLLNGAPLSKFQADRLSVDAEYTS